MNRMIYGKCWWRTLLLAAIVCHPLAGSAALELRGLCVTDDVVQLSFSDSETRQSHGWKRVGESVEGYKIAAYDRKTETATLELGQKTLQLRLQAGVLLKSSAEHPQAITGTLTMKGKGGRRVTFGAELKFGEESTFDLGGDRSVMINPSRMPDGNILYLTSFLDGSGGEPEKRISEPAVVSPPDQSFALYIEGDELAFAPAPR